MHDKTCIIIIVFLNEFANCYEIMKLESKPVCTKKSELFWKMIWPYLKEEYVIRIFGENEDISNEFLQCVSVEHPLPLIKIIEQNENLGEQKPKRNSYQNRDIDAHIIISSKFIKIWEKYKKFSDKSHHNAKTIIVLQNSSYEEAKDILANFWKEYQGVNLALVLFPDELMNKPINISYYNENVNSTLEMLLFSPFHENIDGSKGKFKLFSVNSENVEHIANVLDSQLNKRLENVNGHRIKVCMVPYRHLSEPIKDKNGTTIDYIHIDGFMINLLLKKVNMTAEYVLPRDNLAFGSSNKGTNFTGCLKEVESESVDLIGNMRSIKDKTTNSQFLYPVDDETFIYIAPSFGIKYSVSYTGVFALNATIAIAIGLLISCCGWHNLDKFYFCTKPRTRMKYKKFNESDIFFAVLGSIILVPYYKMPKLHHERCVFMATTIFSMALCFSYQATMVEHLSQAKSLDLQNIYEMYEKGFRIMLSTALANVILMTGSNDDKIYEKIYYRQEYSDDFRDYYKGLVIDKKLVSLTPEYLGQINQAEFFDPKTGEDLISIIKDKRMPRLLRSLLVPKKSPFLARFNDILCRVRESGILTIWKKHYLFRIRIKGYLKRLKIKKIKERVYSMEQLRIVFVCWAVCLMFCVLVLFFEIFSHWWKLNKIKNI